MYISPDFLENIGYLIAGALITGFLGLIGKIWTFLRHRIKRRCLQRRMRSLLKDHFYKGRPEILKKRRLSMAEQAGYYFLRQNDKGKVCSYVEVALLLEALNGDEGKIYFHQDGKGRVVIYTLRKTGLPPEDAHRKAAWEDINLLLCLEGSWAFFPHNFNSKTLAFQYIFSPDKEKKFCKLSKEDAYNVFRLIESQEAIPTDLSKTKKPESSSVKSSTD